MKKRPTMRSATFVKSVNVPGRYGDGRSGLGLTLLVKPSPRRGCRKSRGQSIRINGVFAPNCKHRQRIVPRREPEQAKPGPSPAPMTWMQRLKRVFAIEIETCPKCGGTLRVIACRKTRPVVHGSATPSR